jgi:hypothetical protein
VQAGAASGVVASAGVEGAQARGPRQAEVSGRRWARRAAQAGGPSGERGPRLGGARAGEYAVRLSEWTQARGRAVVARSCGLAARL